KGAITNSSFHDAPDGWAVGFYTANGFTISDNEFIRLNNALKGDNGTDTGMFTAQNLAVQRNYFAYLRRMGAEFQGACNHFLFTDNYYEKPVLSSVENENLSTFAWSIIFNGQTTRDCQVHRNYINTLERPDGHGCRVGFEIGPGFDLSDNYVNGTFNVV